MLWSIVLSMNIFVLSAEKEVKKVDLLTIVPSDCRILWVWRKNPAAEFMEPLLRKAAAEAEKAGVWEGCLLYTSPSPRD